MKEAMARLWRWYSNVFLIMGGKTPTKEHYFWHYMWNTPMGEVLKTAAGRLKQRTLPNVHLPKPPQLTKGRYRLRVLLMLAVSAVMFGCINGFGDAVMMFVSIPVASMMHPGSSEASNFYFSLSIFTAAVIHSIVYRLFLGEEEAPLRSINGMLFFLMDVFFLNLVDGYVMELSLMVDRVPYRLIREILEMAAVLLGVITMAELSENYLTVWISIAAVEIMGLLGSVTYYICLPAILLVGFAGLSEIFTLRFFYDLCTVLIALAITAVLERFGIMKWLRKMCVSFTMLKGFVLATWIVLPVLAALVMIIRCA